MIYNYFTEISYELKQHPVINKIELTNNKLIIDVIGHSRGTERDEEYGEEIFDCEGTVTFFWDNSTIKSVFDITHTYTDIGYDDDDHEERDVTTTPYNKVYSSTVTDLDKLYEFFNKSFTELNNIMIRTENISDSLLSVVDTFNEMYLNNKHPETLKGPKYYPMSLSGGGVSPWS